MAVGVRFGGVVIVISLLSLSACTTLDVPTTEPPPEQKAPAPTVVVPPVPESPPRPATPSASAAYQPLLAKADQAAARGDYEQALALLERAQRIDPDSADIYLGLARTHRARGDSAQASATAERGLLYCSSSAQCDALRAFTR